MVDGNFFFCSDLATGAELGQKPPLFVPPLFWGIIIQGIYQPSSVWIIREEEANNSRIRIE
jgi:hypothetical protein